MNLSLAKKEICIKNTHQAQFLERKDKHIGIMSVLPVAGDMVKIRPITDGPLDESFHHHVEVAAEFRLAPGPEMEIRGHDHVFRIANMVDDLQKDKKTPIQTSIKHIPSQWLMH